jgi:hypothetical protein
VQFGGHWQLGGQRQHRGVWWQGRRPGRLIHGSSSTPLRHPRRRIVRPGLLVTIATTVTANELVFDALIHHGPYKKAWPLNDALSEMQRLSGLQFDPDVIS